MLQRLFQRFDTNYDKWLQAISCVAELDALISLARSSSSGSGEMCRPSFVESKEPFIELQQMRHPCITLKIGQDFIANDLQLGTENNPLAILLTGPNMGGKSTLLRQTCIAIIMAQLGCFIHAEKCVLSPVDRIFTRVGANDDILAGQSTFMVELMETANILRHATKNSVVILDELGRGTSTFDGYSIAYSVLQYLTNTIQCRVLFSTHYHKLTEEFSKSKQIGLHHMACLVDEEKNDVTFLYQLSPGVCPKSYGMNVALMAGVEEKVVKRAEEMAKQFEDISSNVRNQSKSAPILSTFTELCKVINGPKNHGQLLNTLSSGGCADFSSSVVNNWLSFDF